THESNRVDAAAQLYGRGLAFAMDNATHQGAQTAGIAISINRTDPAVSINNASGDALRTYNGVTLQLSIANNGKLSFSNGAINSNAATAGTSGALPAQLRGYLLINMLGTDVKVPYYNV